MALRIRKDGRILCAAIHAAEECDTYIPDQLHYEMSVVHKVIASEPMERHAITGQWWWSAGIPADVEVDPFYLHNAGDVPRESARPSPETEMP
ncbi:MAG: hypothetical protein NTV46_00955 [Verrucomicrobia bacterium]|nr:hypothetical protein [Verrucomicrobiota bacterium]